MRALLDMNIIKGNQNVMYQTNGMSQYPDKSLKWTKFERKNPQFWTKNFGQVSNTSRNNQKSLNIFRISCKQNTKNCTFAPFGPLFSKQPENYFFLILKPARGHISMFGQNGPKLLTFRG